MYLYAEIPQWGAHSLQFFDDLLNGDILAGRHVIVLIDTDKIAATASEKIKDNINQWNNYNKSQFTSKYVAEAFISNCDAIHDHKQPLLMQVKFTWTITLDYIQRILYWSLPLLYWSTTGFELVPLLHQELTLLCEAFQHPTASKTKATVQRSIGVT